MSLDHETEFVKPQTITKDVFLGGKLVILQPADGFRAGMDSVLLGASVAAQTANLLDLGAGVGTASLCALAHGSCKQAIMAEIDPVSAAQARENVATNGFADRALVKLCDVALPSARGTENGLGANHFNCVIANPPFFDAATGTKAPNAARARARHMDNDILDHWVRTAAACAAPKAEIIFIFRADALSILVTAFERRFGGITVLPVFPREGEPATRLLVRGVKGSRAPLTLAPPLFLHAPDGRDFLPRANGIFRGEHTLDW